MFRSLCQSNPMGQLLFRNQQPLSAASETDKQLLRQFKVTGPVQISLQSTDWA